MDPHSLFFQVAAELGLVGLVVFGYFLYQLVRANHFLFRIHSENPSGLDYQLALAFGAELLGIAFLSIVGHTLYRPFWYFTGGLLAASYQFDVTVVNDQSAAANLDHEWRQSRGDQAELAIDRRFAEGRR